jgi:diguanylate cyclase (GGDEF)-like protein
MKPLLSWILPGGVVFLGTLAAALGPEGFVNVASRGFPWIAVGVVAVLAGVRHRSRVVALAMALAVLEVMASGGAGEARGLYLLGALFALSVVALVRLGDRGVLSTVGLLQVGGVALLGVLGALLLSLAPWTVETLLTFDPLPPAAMAWSAVPQVVLVVFLLAGPAAVTVALRRDGAVERAACWSLVIVGTALFLAGNREAVSILLAGAALVLGLSVMDPAFAWASRDELTGLPGRRALLQDLQSMGGTFAAAMVDIDDFRHFNDRYGHDVGDQILRMVASRLAKVPGGARAYRYGGDEFVVLFPGRTESEALQHLGGFVRSLEESPFGLRRWRRPKVQLGDREAQKADGGVSFRRLSVRVSIGGADSVGTDSAPEVVLRRADQAVHRSP